MTGRRTLALLFASTALLLACSEAVSSAQQPVPIDTDVLYAALVLATKSEHPQPVPEEIRPQADDMQKIFGYNDFHILGEKKKVVPTGKEDWLVASRKFILNVDTKNRIAGGYALFLQLREEDRVIVEADVKLKRERPLFIRGPQVGDGQLLILLTVR